METDAAIIGAGAAGLATAIFAASSPLPGREGLGEGLKNTRAARDDDQAAPARRIVLLDGAKHIGAKILVAGGGRCNVTHDHVTADDFNGPRNTIRNILRGFDEQRAVEWFASMGVTLKREDTGKLFPTTDDAHTVLDALLTRCRSLGVEVRTDHRVADVRPRTDGEGFVVTHSRGELHARRVVLATGGRSLPKTGSDGAGWSIAKRLGHTVTATYPALVPLVLEDGFFHASLSGLSHEAELSTFADGKVIDRRTGSMLWTHFGISGPVVMDASRHWVIAHAEGRSPRLVVSLMPGQSFDAVEKSLIDAATRLPQRTVARTIADRLPARLAEALCAHAAVPADTKLTHLKRDDRRRLVHALTALDLPVERDRGWNYAEVTAGGVPMSEVDPRTMQSRVVPGLHLVGEILDVDGRIGGFNFQWAWATGYTAARALATP